ncbi:DUF1127 domain-containing protein [Sulfitobacter noctilucicola]|nr:DUF1127 domain-containing protein [Sulfitobacter noctilucicola]
MAISISRNGSAAVLDAGRTFFNQKREQIARGFAGYAVYRRTRSELASLSDRSLADLGIARSNIRRMALEAAYGV